MSWKWHYIQQLHWENNSLRTKRNQYNGIPRPLIQLEYNPLEEFKNYPSHSSLFFGCTRIRDYNEWLMIHNWSSALIFINYGADHPRDIIDSTKSILPLVNTDNYRNILHTTATRSPSQTRLISSKLLAYYTWAKQQQCLCDLLLCVIILGFRLEIEKSTRKRVEMEGETEHKQRELRQNWTKREGEQQE